MAYIGFSMSERAKEAYISGEKPLSKWTKKEILSEIEETYSIKAAEFCKRFSINFLKKIFIKKSSWHHTGKLYKKTDFYTFCSDIDEDEIFQLKEDKEEKPAEKNFFPASAVWTEFYKTGRRWKTEDVYKYGRCNGKVFIAFDGTKKLCNGKTFIYSNLTDKDRKKSYEMMKKEFKKYFNVSTCHKLNKWIRTGSINS